MADKRLLSSLNELIGKKCTYKFNEEDDIWTDKNTMKCEVLGFEIMIEEPFGKLYISIKICPVKSSDFNKVDTEYLQISGTYLDSVCFDC